MALEDEEDKEEEEKEWLLMLSSSLSLGIFEGLVVVWISVLCVGMVISHKILGRILCEVLSGLCYG